jgi:hypothetical protein
LVRGGERIQKTGKIKPSVACSYGHGAKVLDVAAKVYVYYCGEPSAEIAARLLPMLQAGLDTPMMTDFDPAHAKGTTQEVDRAEMKGFRTWWPQKSPGQSCIQCNTTMWRGGGCSADSGDFRHTSVEATMMRRIGVLFSA